MYLDYFGIDKKPFLITPDPAFIYLSQGHQQALAHLRYGLDREGGFLLLTGEVGTGKTSLCRLLMEELPQRFRLAYILNTRLDSVGVLSGICRELSIDLEGDTAGVNTLVEKIYDNLLAAHGEGSQTLVVIEEAQNLAPEVLEVLRLLTNLETNTTKLLHILLIGQPELLDTLRAPGLRQLNQRVVSRSHLGPLSRSELHSYFRHRLQMAGCTRTLFTPAAIRLIHRRTKGIPRLVNLLAEHCLMGAYATGQPLVSVGIARRAAKEIASTLQMPKPRARWAGVAAVCMAIIVLGVLVVYVQPSGTLDPGLAKESGAASVSAGIVPTEPEQASLVEEDQVPQELDPEIPAEPAVDAFQRLLQAWGIEEAADSPEALCQVASAHQLRCVTLTIASPVELASIDRPVLLTLSDGKDGYQFFTLLGVGDKEVVVANSEGEKSMAGDALLAALRGEVIFLWRPPSGYNKPLVVGDVNHPLVSLVTGRLQELELTPERLITGGVYNEFIASRVEEFQRRSGLAVDGILGVRTLLRLLEPDGDVPRLTAMEEK